MIVVIKGAYNCLAFTGAVQIQIVVSAVPKFFQAGHDQRMKLVGGCA